MRSVLRWCRRFAPVLLIGLAACSLSGEAPTPVASATPETTLPPTSPPTDEPVSCLEGDWSMSTGDLDLLVATLFPETSSFMRVLDGGTYIHFEGGRYEFGGQYVMHVDSLLTQGGYSRAILEFSVTGPFTLQEESTVAFGESSTNYNTVRCQAFKDGQEYEAPCLGMGGAEILLPAESPYRCTPGGLELDTRSPRGTVVTMFFGPSYLE